MAPPFLPGLGATDLGRGRGQAFSWWQDIRKIEAKNVRSVLAIGKADRAQRARDRLPRSTAAGDDTLRNRIEPMHRAKKDAAEAVERQPASLPSQRVPALVGHARRLARGLLSRPSRRAAASDELCNRGE